MSHVIVHSYYDGSAVIQVFGPYEDDSVATAAMMDLQSIGLTDKLQVFKLLPFVPFDETEEFDATEEPR